MKTLIHIFIVAMFGIEICSPFFIAYLNHQQKTKNIYSTRESKTKLNDAKVALGEVRGTKDWRSVDFTESSYSDSKTLSVKE